MFFKNERFYFLIIFVFSSSIVHADIKPHLGKRLSEEKVSLISMTVFPDGEGLPHGSGTAKTGERIYLEQCAYCHSLDGSGNAESHVPALSGKPQYGSDWSTGSSWPYATSIFDYVRRAMPPYNVKKFSADEVYSLTAYILKMNDLIAEDQVMNQESLPKVEMPARKYFRNHWEEEEKYYQLPSY